MKLQRSVRLVLGSAFLIPVCLLSAPPANAATLGTVTITGSAAPYAFSPTTLNSAVGDTFTVVDTNTGGATMSVSYSVGAGDTGEVSVGSQPCTVGQATCIASSGGGTTYTITKLGTVSVTAQPGGTVGKITLQSGSGSTDPKAVYTTMTLDPNGGTCTGSLQFTNFPGSGNDQVTLPTSAACARTNYTLTGWVIQKNAVVYTANIALLKPGSTIPIGSESTTLWAVWSPNGVEVTYDANVGMSTPCLTNGVKVTTAAARSTTVVVPKGSATATTAPCTPADAALAGWSYTGDGRVRLKPGEALPDFTADSSIVTADSDFQGFLFAKWKTTYGITAMLGPVTTGAGLTPQREITFTASLNGAPTRTGLVITHAGENDTVVNPDRNGKALTSVTFRTFRDETCPVTAALGNVAITVNICDNRRILSSVGDPHSQAHGEVSHIDHGDLLVLSRQVGIATPEVLHRTRVTGKMFIFPRGPGGEYTACGKYWVSTADGQVRSLVYDIPCSNPS